VSKHGVARPGWDDSWQEDLQALMRTEPGVRELKLGRAYYATGLDTESDQSLVFPDGADSVLRLMQESDKHNSLASMDSRHKSIAVNLLLSRQGALAAEMDGIRRALKKAREDPHAAGTPAAKRLITSVAERLATVSPSLMHVNEVLMKLGVGFCAFHEMEINAAASNSVYEGWITAWRALPNADSRGALQSGFSVGREGAEAMHKLAGQVKSRLTDRPYVPMARRGGGMRAIGSGFSAVTSVSSTGTMDSDDRCTGSTHWQTSLGTDEVGRRVLVRKLVCQYCGVGASKKLHSYSLR